MFTSFQEKVRRLMDGIQHVSRDFGVRDLDLPLLLLPCEKAKRMQSPTALRNAPWPRDVGRVALLEPAEISPTGNPRQTTYAHHQHALTGTIADYFAPFGRYASWIL